MDERWRNVLNSATGDPLVQVVQSLGAENERLRAVVNDTLESLRGLTDSLRDRAEHRVADDIALMYREIRLRLDVDGEGATDG